MKVSWQLGGALGAALVMAVVTLPAAGPADAPASAAANPTFTRDVLPIFQKSCQSCHRPGQMAPFSLLTYEDARPFARSIKQKVETRYMPPWHLDRTVGEYSPDPSLSDEQIATISRWVDQGAPKGDPKDAPPDVKWPADNTWEFGEPDLVINAPTAHIPALGADQYPTPSVPSGMTEDRYIKWMQVIPGDAKVVHHVLVMAHQKDSALAPLVGDARTRNDNPGAANPNSGRASVAGESVAMLAEYARGNDGDIFDEGQGKLLQAGATISFEFHYHPNGESAATDNTKVGIKFFPKGYVPKHLISTRGISSQEALAIAPGDANSRSDAYFQLAQPARLVSFQPHMHYRGKRMTLEAILPTGQTQLLTDVNRFVWTWQITYPYKNQPVFPKGTMLHMTAYHDNSPGNKENPDPTAFVGWGARTVDEMNIGWLDFYYISDQEYTELQQQNRTRNTNTAQQQ
jgi:mono/diheme cytochrome c family protein